jgi:glycosyltransferase involved in cell wall biosynthesis
MGAAARGLGSSGVCDLTGEPLHIVHVLPNFAEEASGPTYSVSRLAREQLQTGHRVTMATFSAPRDADLSPHVQVFPRFTPLGKLGWSAPMARWIARQARSATPKIIHDHSFWMGPNVMPLCVRRATSVRVVFSPRGTLLPEALQTGSPAKRALLPLARRLLASRCQLLHATSAAEAEALRALGLNQPICLLPNGVDFDPALPTGPMAGGYSAPERTLLYMGRIHEGKGVDLLLAAWEALAAYHREWALRIVGPTDTAHARQLQQRVSTSRLERVSFVGPRYGADKMAEYARADLCVLPSRFENFGLVVAEALARGVPAVVTHGAPWETLAEETGGWYVPRTVEALQAALRHAMRLSPEQRAGIGQAGRAWARERLDWARISSQMVQAYQWSLGLADRPGCIHLD